MYLYMYIYMHTYIHTYINIHTYIHTLWWGDHVTVTGHVRDGTRCRNECRLRALNPKP